MNVRRCAVDSLIVRGRHASALRIVERLAKFDDSRPVATYALQKMLQDPDPAALASRRGRRSDQMSGATPDTVFHV